MSSAVRVGDIIHLTKDAVEHYGEQWDVDLRVDHVATSVEEHPGYDPGLGGEVLVDSVVAETGEEVPFSVYRYEFHRKR